MAKKQVRKMQIQTEDTIFALDIGTRSIIGMVGMVENDKVKIVAIEKEDHLERAMIDGQIENIEKVSALAGKVKKRLEDKLNCKLKRVCVAAAGRALRTKRAEFGLELPGTQLIDDELISRLEAGAISRAEEAFDAENSAEDDTRRFYLVGYTVCHYYLDQYMISSLKDHRGKQIKVDLIATFLPSEVVESLYTTMNKIDLEVASITLEPIAAINAAIPENLRLLNLVMVDIGAGTSDIAACTGGSVTGYTMATVAGDEVTETIMRQYLVDFGTAETMKAQMDQEKEISYINILGMPQTTPREELLKCIQGTSELLCKEIAGKILEVNGGPPSALFLAGGGSKLAGLKEGLTVALQMDTNFIAIAGSNFQANAYSEEYDLNNPEYATPLGIAISSGLNLINDSFRVLLNNRPAKLFRSGSFTALNLLMMNGYNFQDILGRTGLNLTVTVNGRRKTFYGTAAQPATLLINKKEGKLSEVIHAGDSIDFEPAIHGISAKACLGDIEGAHSCLEITLNGASVSLNTPLKNGDVIMIKTNESFLQDTQSSEKVETNKEQAQPERSDLANESVVVNIDVPVEPDYDWISPEQTTAMAKEIVSVSVMEMSQGSLQETDWKDTAGDQETGEYEKAGPFRKIDVEESNDIPSDTGQSETADFYSETVPSETVVRNRAEIPADRKIDPVKAAVGEAASYDHDDLSMQNEILKSVSVPENMTVGEDIQETDTLEIPEPDITFTSPKHGITEHAFEHESGPAVPVSADLNIPKKQIIFYLNDAPISLLPKEDGEPYYLMDMIQYSGIDLAHPKGTVTLSINGEPGMFQQELMEGDHVRIVEEVTDSGGQSLF